MVNGLGMTLEQQQRFFDPIIKFIKENPHLFDLVPKQSNSRTQEQTSEK
ncbi:hypothetical protein P9133_01110 [Bacillus thuringiensis]|uniref:Uncharacterized protein n=1 Tax=Bacillus cereus TIAC219 TaxID=718222 RepID=A0ABC9SNZ4_BACCE|nr:MULTISPECIES: hypothetical protein [Bacillus cereus group]EJP80956.1 hypothetical protein IC1_06769 [Bacillus cereus VD022]EOQ54491.1 hypothetical protein IAY_06803 [Bacillus cereus TIAC219]MEC3263079.1 hypothetical protein [Bacillus thuringiensis]MEC3516297.1 hypothetical protein [Bacillus thuringiensis]MED2071211.1 hypothetical protein [Bacillus thuringiensis]